MPPTVTIRSRNHAFRHHHLFVRGQVDAPPAGVQVVGFLTGQDQVVDGKVNRVVIGCTCNMLVKSADVLMWAIHSKSDHPRKHPGDEYTLRIQLQDNQGKVIDNTTTVPHIKHERVLPHVNILPAYDKKGDDKVRELIKGRRESWGATPGNSSQECRQNFIAWGFLTEPDTDIDYPHVTLYPAGTTSNPVGKLGYVADSGIWEVFFNDIPNVGFYDLTVTGLTSGDGFIQTIEFVDC